MEKKDLRSGMVIVNREGRKAIVFLNSREGDVLGGYDGNNSAWCPLTAIENDLTYKGIPNSDIVKIYSPDNNRAIGSVDIHKGCFTLVWERSETIELTIDDIAKKFGVPVNTIKIKK
jgi:hypothetical protein